MLLLLPPVSSQEKAGGPPVAKSGNPARPRITGIAHIAFFAKDIEKSRAFYRDFLGFEEPYSLKNPDGSLSMAFFKINERQYIELIPEREPNTDRLSHISIETDNAEALRVYLASRGVAVPDRLPKGKTGNWNFFVTDPEGHRVEIMQYDPAGWTVREKGKHVPATRISTHIPHVGIIVAHFNPEYKFYTDVLGFREILRTSRDGVTLSWVNLQVPEGDDYIEFMLMKDYPPPTGRGTAHHLGFETADIAASVATLEARPSRAQYPHKLETRVGVNRRRQANMYDPDGSRSELMEPATIDGKPVPSSTAPPPQL
jgi:catechol 2,3-dioxygenase-like lactoylglutathione lyase family enzyme